MIQQKIMLKTPQKKLVIDRHSVLILCGPSECGKSFFATECQAQLIKRGFSCSVISSDTCRRDILNSPNEHKHSDRMMGVSREAFSMAYAKLKEVTSYPTNTDVVIFDSTALSSKSRKQISKIAAENKYSCQIVMFDYDDEKEYYKYTDADWLVDIHLKKFRAEKPEGYRITRREVPLIEVNQCKSIYLDNKETVIISDIHGHYEEFVALLTKTGFWNNEGTVNTDKNFVLVGDLIDKGKKSHEVISFVLPYVISGNIRVVRGNHENWVVKRRSGEITQDNGREHFDSIDLCDHFHEKLKEVWLRSYDYVKSDNFIVTHSPCDVLDLEKDTKAMRNFRHSRFTPEEMGEQMKRMSSQRTSEMPLHVFGHIEFDAIYQQNGMFGIDSPDKLRAIVLNGRNTSFYHVEKAK
jgi:predicted kinase